MVAALCAYVTIQANMEVSTYFAERAGMAQMSNIGIGYMLLQ